MDLEATAQLEAAGRLKPAFHSVRALAAVFCAGAAPNSCLSWLQQLIQQPPFQQVPFLLRERKRAQEIVGPMRCRTALLLPAPGH